jgi:hypothetical protein
VASHGLFVWSQLRLHGWCALMMIDARKAVRTRRALARGEPGFRCPICNFLKWLRDSPVHFAARRGLPSP